MGSKTPAQRKAEERKRMKAEGFTQQLVWIHNSQVERFRKYVARLRSESEQESNT